MSAYPLQALPILGQGKLAVQPGMQPVQTELCKRGDAGVSNFYDFRTALGLRGLFCI